MDGNFIELEMNGRRVTVMGGPYRDRPAGIKAIKLAEEINATYNVKLDIPDFRVPQESSAYAVALIALAYLYKERVIFMGCMGGMGRTGLFMAVIIKAVGHFNEKYESKGLRGLKNKFLDFLGLDNGLRRCRTMRASPVEFVRENYNPHAVETSEQYKFVMDFDWSNSDQDFWAIELGHNFKV